MKAVKYFFVGIVYIIGFVLFAVVGFPFLMLYNLGKSFYEPASETSSGGLACKGGE